MPLLTAAREWKRRNGRQPGQRSQFHAIAAVILMPMLAAPALAQPVAKAEIVANLGHTSGQCCALYLPDGKHLISAGNDRSVRLWDRTTGRLIRTFHGSSAIESIAVVPDGSIVLAGTTEGVIELWEAVSGRLVSALQGHKKDVMSLAVSADGGYVASGGRDGTVRIWNTATGQSLRVIADHGSPVRALALTAGKPSVISGDENGVVAVHDLATGKITRKWKAHPSHVMSLAVTPDGSRVVTGSLDQLVRVWDAATGKLVRTIEGHTGGLNGVAVAADGTRIASVAGDRSIRVWDTRDRQEAAEAGPTSSLNLFSVAFSPDGKQLLFTGTGRGAAETRYRTPGRSYANTVGPTRHSQPPSPTRFGATGWPSARFAGRSTCGTLRRPDCCSPSRPTPRA